MSDLRTRNRQREHGTHGWRVSEKQAAIARNRPGMTFMVCPCGWSGWISAQ